MKYEGKIQDNYDKYLNEPLKIGFISSLPMVKIIDTLLIKTVCRKFDVSFNVYLAKLNYGRNTDPIDKFNVTGIYTDKVNIAHKLWLGGFGSHCHVDEAKVMKLGVIEMAKKHNLMICEKICSWNFAKAVVQSNFYKD